MPKQPGFYKKPKSWTINDYHKSYYEMNKDKYHERYLKSKERKKENQDLPKDYYYQYYRQMNSN